MAACAVTAMGLLSCGTSSSVSQPLSGAAARGPVYVMGSSKSADSDATQKTCDELRNVVQYGLLKRGLYAKSDADARRRVNLTITYFRDVGAWGRAFWGVMSGKDGMDATVEVVDIQSGKIIGSATASTFNVTAMNTTETSMANAVGGQIVEFLASGQ